MAELETGVEDYTSGDSPQGARREATPVQQRNAARAIQKLFRNKAETSKDKDFLPETRRLVLENKALVEESKELQFDQSFQNIINYKRDFPDHRILIMMGEYHNGLDTARANNYLAHLFFNDGVNVYHENKYDNDDRTQVPEDLAFDSEEREATAKHYGFGLEKHSTHFLQGFLKALVERDTGSKQKYYDSPGFVTIAAREDEIPEKSRSNDVQIDPKSILNAEKSATVTMQREKELAAEQNRKKRVPKEMTERGTAIWEAQDGPSFLPTVQTKAEELLNHIFTLEPAPEEDYQSHDIYRRLRRGLNNFVLPGKSDNAKKSHFMKSFKLMLSRAKKEEITNYPDLFDFALQANRNIEMAEVLVQGLKTNKQQINIAKFGTRHLYHPTHSIGKYLQEEFKRTRFGGISKGHEFKKDPKYGCYKVGKDLAVFELDPILGGCMVPKNEGDKVSAGQRISPIEQWLFRLTRSHVNYEGKNNFNNNKEALAPKIQKIKDEEAAFASTILDSTGHLLPEFLQKIPDAAQAIVKSKKDGGQANPFVMELFTFTHILESPALAVDYQLEYTGNVRSPEEQSEAVYDNPSFKLVTTGRRNRYFGKIDSYLPKYLAQGVANVVYLMRTPNGASVFRFDAGAHGNSTKKSTDHVAPGVNQKDLLQGEINQADFWKDLNILSRIRKGLREGKVSQKDYDRIWNYRFNKNLGQADGLTVDSDFSMGTLRELTDFFKTERTPEYLRHTLMRSYLKSAKAFLNLDLVMSDMHQKNVMLTEKDGIISPMISDFGRFFSSNDQDELSLQRLFVQLKEGELKNKPNLTPGAKIRIFLRGVFNNTLFSAATAGSDDEVSSLAYFSKGEVSFYQRKLAELKPLFSSEEYNLDPYQIANLEEHVQFIEETTNQLKEAEKSKAPVDEFKEAEKSKAPVDEFKEKIIPRRESIYYWIIGVLPLLKQQVIAKLKSKVSPKKEETKRNYFKTIDTLFQLAGVIRCFNAQAESKIAEARFAELEQTEEANEVLYDYTTKHTGLFKDVIEKFAEADDEEIIGDEELIDRQRNDPRIKAFAEQQQSSSSNPSSDYIDVLQLAAQKMADMLSAATHSEVKYKRLASSISRFFKSKGSQYISSNQLREKLLGMFEYNLFSHNNDFRNLVDSCLSESYQELSSNETCLKLTKKT